MPKRSHIVIGAVVASALGLALLLKYDKKQDAILKTATARKTTRAYSAGRPNNHTQVHSCDDHVSSDVTALPVVATHVVESGSEHGEINSRSVAQQSHIKSNGAHSAATFSAYEPSVNQAREPMPMAQCGGVASPQKGSYASRQPMVDLTDMPRDVTSQCPSQQQVTSFAEGAQTGTGVTFSTFSTSHMPSAVQVASDSRHSMQLDRLMPASWREGAKTTDAASDEWSKHIPSKDKFSNYITASGSSRLAMSDRSVIPSRLVGGDYSGRPKPAVPVSTGSLGIGDSAFRMDLAAAATGMYASGF